MQNLGRPFHGIDLRLILQPVDSQRHHTVESLHMEVIVIVLLELCRRIDQVRRILAIKTVGISPHTQLPTTTGHSTILSVSLDALYKPLQRLCREFQRIFLVS